jgi:hypothetical protein
VSRTQGDNLKPLLPFPCASSMHTKFEMKVVINRNKKYVYICKNHMKIMAHFKLPPKFAIQIISKIPTISMNLLLGFDYISTQ